MAILQRLSSLTPRQTFFGAFLFCFGLIAAGLVLQHFKGIAPCPLCIMQRYAFVACGLFALLAAAHNPALLGRRIWATLMGIAALTGLGIAIRQTWLQWFPPEQVMCGPDLAYMVNAFPLGKLLPMLFNGDGDCSKIDWSFLGLSLANWAVIFFLLLLATAILQLRRR